MIKLVFMLQKEAMCFIVDGREIYYTDRIWKKALRIIPRDEEFIKKLQMSRNKIPAWFIDKFNLSEQDKKEYDDCKTEQELADRIIFDCKKKGLVLIDTKKE